MLRLLAVLAALGLLAAIALGLFAPKSPSDQLPAIATPPPQAATLDAELATLIARIKQKLGEGKDAAADFQAEFAAFDTLLAKYQGQKTDAVAQILYLHAALYGEVFADLEKAAVLFNRLKAEFPGTAPALRADDALAAYTQRARIAAARTGVIGQPAPELDFTWSTRDGLKRLADLRGKVVVLDFWATWCGPCLTSFPEMRALTAHYRDADVVVLGVTALQGRVSNLGPATIETAGDPQREMALMHDFIKAHEMTWPVAFSTQEVFNPDYGIAGIPHLAIITPDGTVRHNGLHPAIPLAEKTTKIDALLREFGKPVPAAASAGQ